MMLNQVLIQTLALTPPTVEPDFSEPTQGVTSVNADNLSITRRPANVTAEPSIFITRVEVEAMLQKNRRKWHLWP